MNPPLPASRFASRRTSFPLWRLATSVLALAPLAVLPAGYALPTGAQVAAGNVAITQSGARMTIDQTSRNAIVNWQSFNVGAGERLQLNQGGAGAALLARVTGNDPSALLGSLQADGKLFLINPRGVVVGAGAVIDTGAFMASTLNVSDADFLRGAGMTFQGDSAAGIVNLGRITAHEGNVLLFAHTVKNAGAIAAPQGTAALGAGTEVYLGSPDDGSMVIKFNLPKTAEKTGVENSGTIEAAQAQLKAAGGSIYELAINQRGVIRATGVENKNGRVLLTADGGTVGVGGRVTARNADGGGGEILVGGDAHGANPDVPNASHTAVTADAVLDASAATASGAGGRVVVWSDQATRFLGTIDAHGAGGGFAEVSGRHGLEFAPAAPVNLGANGTLLLDPDALVVSSGTDSGTSASGTNPFTFGATTTPATLNVTTLQNQLASSNVILDTSSSTGDITFNAPVTWATPNSLTAKAGGSINVNQSIMGSDASSALVLNPGKSTLQQVGQAFITVSPRATLAAAAAISVGTLTYGTNGSAAPGGATVVGGANSADFQGNLNVGTLQVDLSNGGTGVVTSGSSNSIGVFKTTGTGDLTSVNVANHHGALDVQLTAANASAPHVQVTTPGTLTLLAGSSLSFANQTDVVLASTGAGFVNQAGAGVFGTNARFLVYASSAGATTKGGLTGIDVFSHAYNAGDDFSADTSSRFLFNAASSLPFLNYTADNQSRAYGASNPAFTATVTGFQGGVTNDVTGAPTFSTTATQSSGVGGYAINVARGTLASLNYDFSFTPGTLSVTQAPLTITANNSSRTPNTANPGFGVSYSGFVNGENSSVVSGLTVGTSANLSSPVGTYPITPASATAANYAISFVPGTLTITDTAPLTIAADSFTRIYGAAGPAFTASINGLIGTDTTSVVSGLQFNTAAQQSSGVGTYAITPFGATAPGYVISFVPGTLTIDRASLLISPQNAARFYGDANPALTASFSGLVNGDTAASIAGLTFSTAATTASNVGAYPITVSGGANPNYNISLGGSAQLTVKPAPLTVTFDDKTRVYGDANPALTYTVNGLKNGDSASSAVSIADVHTTAATTDGIGAYGINGLVLPQSSNYDVKGVGGTFTITPRSLTITADNKTKVYGDPNPALTATFTGLAPFDTASAIPNVQLSTTATLTSGVSSLGYGILVNSDLNRNYSISYKFGSLAITPAPLLVFAPPDVERTYGRADPVLPAPDFGGLKNADTIAGLRASYVNVPAPTADAGTYTYGIAINNPNYKLSGPATGLFRVDPAPLDVRIDGDGRTYGDPNPASYTFSATGLAFGQTASSILKVTNPTDQTTGVGIYALQAQATSKNYYINSVTGGNFQINPRVLTFSIDNVAKFYADPIPDFTYNFGAAGLAPSDNITAIISGFKTAVPVGTMTDVGLYRIDPIFKANPNYLVSWTPAYLAILPRPIELTINNAVAFGNDNVPAGFSTAGTGVDLVHPRHEDPGIFDGFKITATNLPAGVTLHDIYPGLGFDVNVDNNPLPVAESVDLSKVFPKTTATAPQATTATVSPAASTNSTLASDAVVIATLPAAFDTAVYAVIDGKVVKNPSAAQQVLERFADHTYYVAPTRYANSNYAVTKITTGLLTFKIDPDLVRISVEIALKKDERARAQAQFDNAGKTGAFGLPPDMFKVLFELLGKMCNDCLVSGDVGPGSLYYAVNGGPGKLFTGGQDQMDKVLFWLADIHSNTLKQSLLLPGLLEYTMNVAGRDPKTWSDADSKLVTLMTPFVQKAQEDFAKSLSAEKAAWLAKQNSAAGAAAFMLGTTDEYEEVITNAVLDVSKSATDKVSTEVKKLQDDAKNSLTDMGTDATYGQVTTALKYSIDAGLSGAGVAAGVAATRAFLTNPTATGIAAIKMKPIQKMLNDYTAKLDEALQQVTKDSTKFGEDFSSTLRDQASNAIQESVAKTLQSDASQARLADAYDKAYQEALTEGKTAKDAAKIADEATSSEVEKIASDAGKQAFQDVADDLAKNADVISDHVKTPEIQKLADKAWDEAYKKSLFDSGGKSDAKAVATRAADAARKQVLQDSADEVAKTLIQQSADKASEEFGAQLVKESVTSTSKLADQVGTDVLAKVTTQAGETAEKLALKLGGKVSTEVLTKASQEGAEAVGKLAVAGVEGSVKMATMTTKAATMLAELSGGPVGIIELAVQVAVQAGSSAAERAEQDKRLNDLINSGSKPVDLHAMATDENGRAIMMMGLLKMFSVQNSTGVTVGSTPGN